MGETKEKWLKTLRDLYKSMHESSHQEIAGGSYKVIIQVARVWTLRLIELVSKGEVSRACSNAKREDRLLPRSWDSTITTGKKMQIGY
jgi:hypothetical protein